MNQNIQNPILTLALIFCWSKAFLMSTMKLVKSRSLVRGFLSGNNGIVIEGVKRIDSFEASTPTASVCSSESLSDDGDDIGTGFGSYNSDSADQQLIEKAESHAAVDQVMAAARLLRKVKNQDKLQKHHKELLVRGSLIDQILSDCLPNAEEDGWKPSFESHGKHDIKSYYKTNEKNEMTARIEAIIPMSLALPVIAILCEVELLHTWMPRFTFPAKIGFGKSEVLRKMGRAGQILEAGMDLPWPMASRVVFAEVTLMDLVDDDKVFMGAVNSQLPEDLVLPERKGVERMAFDVGVVLRKCPEDYPGLLKSKQNKRKKSGATSDEPMLLFSANASIRPSINIVTRTFFGPMIYCLLRLAERVKDGKMSQYDDALKKYDWVMERIEKLFP